MIRAAVLGQDVSRSRSPDIHNAAYRSFELEGRYEAISVAENDFRAKVRELIQQGYRYFNVTIPHKRLAARLATERSPAVEMTGAANTLVVRRGRDGKVSLYADNTDGDGLVAALADLGVRLGRRSQVAMVGAGGAAAGALLALVKRGATVHLLARRRAPAQSLRRRLPEGLRDRVHVAPLDPPSLLRHLAGADVLISAVPAVAWEDEALRRCLSALPRGAAVVEMAYGTLSPLAQAARAHTFRYQDGLPMLVHQAARAIHVALRKRPEVAPLFKAVRKPV